MAFLGLGKRWKRLNGITDIPICLVTRANLHLTARSLFFFFSFPLLHFFELVTAASCGMGAEIWPRSFAAEEGHCSSDKWRGREVLQHAARPSLLPSPAASDLLDYKSQRGSVLDTKGSS